jgi:hypothetical protein
LHVLVDAQTLSDTLCQGRLSGTDVADKFNEFASM